MDIDISSTFDDETSRKSKINPHGGEAGNQAERTELDEVVPSQKDQDASVTRSKLDSPAEERDATVSGCASNTQVSLEQVRTTETVSEDCLGLQALIEGVRVRYEY